MKLHILSDLHLNTAAYKPQNLIDRDAVVVLPGDIGKDDQGIRWARNTYPEHEIVYAPGNHEFYGSQRIATMALMRKSAQECRVHLLDNDEAIIGGVRFLGATLWTDFCLFGRDAREIAMMEGGYGLNDFRLIREGANNAFSPTRSIDLHEISLVWLSTKLDEPFDGSTVVVTHHLPSMQSVDLRFKESLLSACFASNLDHLFGKMELWVHGHTHSSMDYEASGTRVVCNPRGYAMDGNIENSRFNPDLMVEMNCNRKKCARSSVDRAPPSEGGGR